MREGNYFRELNYTLGDEDSGLERRILPENVGHVVTVAGAGGRVLSLLARKPQRLTCIDVSAPQLHITELRLATLRALSYAEFLGFWGYPPESQNWSAVRRRETLKCIISSLSAEAQIFLSAYFHGFSYGRPVYQGRFERSVIALSKINRFVTGCRGRNIFLEANPIAAREYYLQRFPHTRFSIVLFILGNSVVLNSILYRGEFPKKNIPGSTYSIYRRVFSRLLGKLPPRESFFLQLAFLGELKYSEGNPDECLQDVYSSAKIALNDTKVELRKTDYRTYFQHDSCLVDFVSFSDVPSFLTAQAATKFLQDMSHRLAPNALVITRSHLRVVRPDTRGFDVVSDKYSTLAEQERTQLWQVQVYRKQT